jgi:hypothetical protein
MTNTAKRLKSSARMSAPSSFTAVTIPESQERGAALEKADLQDAIKSVLHSQQPGLFPTHIRDWLMVERKELLGRYSNKDSIKTAVNQALNTMIEKGEVVRREATTDKGGRSHLYALLDVAQSDEPKFIQSSSDWDSGGLPDDAFIQHTVALQAGISDSQSPRPLKVEYQSPADSLPERKEAPSPDTYTSARAKDLKQPTSATKFEKETADQFQTSRESGVSQCSSLGLCVRDDADGQGSANDAISHSNSPSRHSGLEDRAQEARGARATPLLDNRESRGAELDQGRQQINFVTNQRSSNSRKELESIHTDISRTNMTRLGQQVVYGRELRARRDKLVREKAEGEIKRDEALSELSKSLSTVNQGTQRLEALNRESLKLRDRMVEVDRHSSDLKRQVDEGKQIVELRRVEVQECEKFVEITEIECSRTCQELRSAVQSLDIF